MLPHERYSWISRLGVVEPGNHVIDAPLHVPRDYALTGSRGGSSRIVSRDRERPVIELEGTIGGIELNGGKIGLNIPDGSRGATAWEVLIRDPALIGLWVGRCHGARIERCVVFDAPDNGVQLESPTDCELHSCAILGTFGNKALDSSHGDPSYVRLIHLTVVALRGYGVGLLGWKVGRNNVLMNSAIFAPPPGPGASGYAVHLPNGIAAGRFASNVVQGGVAGALDAPARQFDPSGVLAEDLPLWQAQRKLNPARSRRMYQASLRTAFTRDLEGTLRVPWRGSLAVGAVASSRT